MSEHQCLQNLESFQVHACLVAGVDSIFAADAGGTMAHGLPRNALGGVGMARRLTQALVALIGFRPGVALALEDASDPSLESCGERGAE